MRAGRSKWPRCSVVLVLPALAILCFHGAIYQLWHVHYHPMHAAVSALPPQQQQRDAFPKGARA